VKEHDVRPVIRLDHAASDIGTIFTAETRA
jgi:hypothetical protein